MTLNEVGKLAGVSRMTVSRYFNGGYVSEENRKKIEAIVNETGFRPSAQAKALKTKKTNTIGVLISALESNFLVEVINKMTVELEEKGYQIMIMRYLQSKDLLIQQIYNLMARGVDGLIVSLVVYDSEIENVLVNTPFPVVTFGSRGFARISSVVHDDCKGIYLLVDYLKKKGYTKIGFIGPSFAAQMSKVRVNATKDAMQKYNLEIREDWFIECENEELSQLEQGQILARKLYELETKPEAMIGASDQIAIGAMFMCERLGMKMPEEIGICGYGNVEVGRFLNPALTTVDMNQVEIVDKVLSLLLEQINKNEKICKKEVVKPLLIKRDSI